MAHDRDERTRARRIQAAIRGVLLKDWDPIGVTDIPEAADEYDSYVGPVYRKLSEGATKEEVARLLRSIEAEKMGLGRDLAPLLPVAGKLLGLRVGLRHWSRPAHKARITWTAEHVTLSLPAVTEMIDPVWFVLDGEAGLEEEGWSLVVRFERSPAEQGNPSEAEVTFLVEDAPHERLTPGGQLKLFERGTRGLASVEILE
jgi:hypothetical protein